MHARWRAGHTLPIVVQGRPGDQSSALTESPSSADLPPKQDAGGAGPPASKALSERMSGKLRQDLLGQILVHEEQHVHRVPGGVDDHAERGRQVAVDFLARDRL